MSIQAVELPCTAINLPPLGFLILLVSKSASFFVPSAGSSSIIADIITVNITSQAWTAIVTDIKQMESVMPASSAQSTAAAARRIYMNLNIH